MSFWVVPDKRLRPLEPTLAEPPAEPLDPAGLGLFPLVWLPEASVRGETWAPSAVLIPAPVVPATLDDWPNT